MGLTLPTHCPRGRTDCQPLAQVISDGDDPTFICCGRNDGTSRPVPEDCFTLCTKSVQGDHPSGTDIITYCDQRDLLDTIGVVARALSFDQYLYPEEKT